MVYELFKCPVCGATKLKEKSRNVNNQNTYVVYKCLACSSIVSHEFEEKKQMSVNDIFKNNLKSIVEITSDFNDVSLSGTAILLKNNYAITNSHVVFRNGKIANCIYGNFFGDTKTFSFELISNDDELDLALLSFKNVEYAALQLDNITSQTGERVFAIGNAIGQGLSVVDGIVSDSCRNVNGNNYIMHSAPVNHGNSGGPLFNSKGQLIGIISSSRKDANNMSYAIPITTLIDFVKDVL